MSGNDVVVDTSLIINLFNGVTEVQPLIEGRNLFISVISEIEILSFPKLKNKLYGILFLNVMSSISNPISKS